jgi:hypothetical protein
LRCNSWDILLKPKEEAQHYDKVQLIAVTKTDALEWVAEHLSGRQLKAPNYLLLVLPAAEKLRAWTLTTRIRARPLHFAELISQQRVTAVCENTLCTLLKKL